MNTPAKRPSSDTTSVALTATERSAARYARAAAVIPPISLDAERAAKFERILAATGESRAAWVRRMIDETKISN